LGRLQSLASVHEHNFRPSTSENHDRLRQSPARNATVLAIGQACSMVPGACPVPSVISMVRSLANAPVLSSFTCRTQDRATMPLIDLSRLAMRQFGKQWFIKDIPNARYFHFGGAAATFWSDLITAPSLEQASHRFLKRYPASSDACRDLPGLVQALSDTGLLNGECAGDANSSVPHAGNADDIQDLMYRTSRSEHRPLLAEYEMTYRCNLRCVYCYQPLYLKHERCNELSPDEISSMLDDFADAGVFFLVITGGECMLTKSFEHAVREARRRCMDVSILTNGTAIKPETVELLASQNVSEVKISIYGSNAEEYRAFTGFSSAFERVLASLRSLKEAGVKVIAKVVVTREQEKSYRKTLALLGAMDIQTEASGYVMPAMDGSTYPLKYRVADEVLEDLFREKLVKSAAGKACTAGSTKFRVSPTGDVTTCELERTPLGNVRQDRVLTLLRSSKGAELIQIISASAGERSRDPMTSALPCPALSKIEHGSWNVPSTEAQRWTSIVNNQ
jgi:MoaA/NifB/PqqE/SkfB family radical SAM enzyme